MKKVVVLATLLTILSTSIYATDLLSLATNGAFNDNSLGVKTLSTKEMREVKGGYELIIVDGSDIDLFQPAIMMAIAMPDDLYELSVKRNNNGTLAEFLPNTTSVGICGLGVTECYQNGLTRTHWKSNEERFFQYTDALGPYKLSLGYYLSFLIIRNIGVSDLGQRYSYFTYKPAAVNLYNGSVSYPYTSLDNPIIHEIKAYVEKDFTDRLGGLWIR